MIDYVHSEGYFFSSQHFYHISVNAEITNSPTSFMSSLGTLSIAGDFPFDRQHIASSTSSLKVGNDSTGLSTIRKSSSTYLFYLRL